MQKAAREDDRRGPGQSTLKAEDQPEESNTKARHLMSRIFISSSISLATCERAIQSVAAHYMIMINWLCGSGSPPLSSAVQCSNLDQVSRVCGSN